MHAAPREITPRGMLTFRVMSQLALRADKPVLSSNLCLARALLRETGGRSMRREGR